MLCGELSSCVVVSVLLSYDVDTLCCCCCCVVVCVCVRVCGVIVCVCVQKKDASSDSEEDERWANPFAPRGSPSKRKATPAAAAVANTYKIVDELTRPAVLRPSRDPRWGCVLHP